MFSFCFQQVVSELKGKNVNEVIATGTVTFFNLFSVSVKKSPARIFQIYFDSSYASNFPKSSLNVAASCWQMNKMTKL